MPTRQPRRIRLVDRVRRDWPDWDEATVRAAIAGGEIVVDGRILSNGEALVLPGAAVRRGPPADPAGRRKLAWAIDRFGVDATGCTVVDVGASTGGFTTAWLAAGAARVYAVDAGHGQLLGSLRQDPRVVDLERTNVAALGTGVVPVAVDRLSVDVSYLSLTSAVEQAGVLDFAAGATLLGLVKPMFELRLPTIPSDRATLERARDAAIAGIVRTGWELLDADECPVHGGRGAVEFFVHAARR
jgi:23S rRNA (cytidine1920-2'-O)/16S rRNA (cytidine1409-2'-O)-methyltransferase